MEVYILEDCFGAGNIVTSRYQRDTSVIQIISKWLLFLLWFTAMDQKIWCWTTPTRLIKEKLLLESYKFFQRLSQSELHLGWNRLEENFSSWVKWIFPEPQNTILHKECSMFFFEEEPYDRVLPRNELYSCTHVSGPRDRRISVLGLHIAHGIVAPH